MRSVYSLLSHAYKTTADIHSAVEQLNFDKDTCFEKCVDTAEMEKKIFLLKSILKEIKQTLEKEVK